MEAASHQPVNAPAGNIEVRDSAEVIHSKVVAGLAGLLAILLVSYFLRAHTISSGLPYFYNEDEAHHFNRVVEMVQRGEFNPNYFHKPSLHFYLRMPVVAVAFLWTVKNGHIRSIQDIRTRDPQGLSGYSLTASHPGIVKWNRALSVLFALGTIFLTASITFVLSRSIPWSLASALIACFSPGFIEYGAVIGVDMPTTFFCTATILLGLIHRRSDTFLSLLACCVTAGFAISTKYNALPIALIPVLAALASNRPTPGKAVAGLILPGIFFFAASPFILTSIPLFLDQFAYEIWHYGQAAHIGHSAEPGLQQAGFYAGWLARDGIGLVGLVLCLGGMLALFEKRRESVLLLAFPVSYFVLMSLQQTHFERNMLMLLGILPAFAGYALYRIERLFAALLFRFLIPALITLTACIPLLSTSLAARSDAAGTQTESRDAAHHWIETHSEPLIDTAIAGELQLPLFRSTQRGIHSLTAPGTERLPTSAMTIPALYQLGFTRMVVGPDVTIPSQLETFVTLEHSIAGRPTLDRIPENPEIRIYRLSDSALDQPALILSELQAIPELESECAVPEGHCWVSTRISRLPDNFPTRIEAFSPSGPQQVRFFTAAGAILQQNQIPEQMASLSVPQSTAPRFLFVPEIHVPAQRSESPDMRRLGIGYRPLP